MPSTLGKSAVTSGGFMSLKKLPCPFNVTRKTGKESLFNFVVRTHQGSIICHIQWKAEVLSECMNYAYLALTDYLKIMKLGLVLMMNFF